ncbi:MAG: PDGLE domain-containing protein [Candidatus Bathyarchaeota archaeon]|nr:PDGLE domain-containing protein [Candidatus Bathyarchaeota archaeon]MCX8177311.1 PDGLE domain-containing protein [Candidatus Bathyarchaeota archaeon]MDW8193757.1 PDGLE domain-containing protein [Nitrososphaerota archaeon]
MQEAAKALMLVLLSFAVLTPFASTYPDGLERVAETIGVEEPEPVWGGLMPDYTLPIIENPYASTVLAGFIGAVMVAAASFALGKTLNMKKR